MNTDIEQETQARKRRFSGLQVLGIVFGTILVTALITGLVVRYYFFQNEFRPVKLNAREQQVLDNKLARLESAGLPALRRGQTENQEPGQALEPEAYSEDDAKREISLTEKELNSLLANNTNLAQRLAIDLSNNLASAKLLVPMDPDFPLVGGKTIKVKAGVEMSFTDGRPVVVLRGVSIMGVPIPNAWLGNLKNVDLVQEFGGSEGFWKAFAAGIEYINVQDGELKLKLKE